jgi:hypothetical protein
VAAAAAAHYALSAARAVARRIPVHPELAVPRPSPNPTYAPFIGRVDPTWSAEWVRRTLTDEPGKGMGSPFSEAHARLFLRACGLAAPNGEAIGADAAELLERMLFWVETDGGTRPPTPR